MKATGRLVEIFSIVSAVAGLIVSGSGSGGLFVEQSADAATTNATEGNITMATNMTGGATNMTSTGNVTEGTDTTNSTGNISAYKPGSKPADPCCSTK